MLIFLYSICVLTQYEFIREDNFTLCSNDADTKGMLEISLTRILFEFNNNKLESKLVQSAIKHIKCKKYSKILLEIIDLMIILLTINSKNNIKVENDNKSKLIATYKLLYEFKVDVQVSNLCFTIHEPFLDLRNINITDTIHTKIIMGASYRFFIHHFMLFVKSKDLLKFCQYLIQSKWLIDYGKYYNGLNEKCVIDFCNYGIVFSTTENHIYSKSMFESKDNIIIFINIRSFDQCLLMFCQKICSFLNDYRKKKVI